MGFFDFLATPQQQDPADAALQGALSADENLKKAKLNKGHLDIQTGFDKAMKAIFQAQKEGEDEIARIEKETGLPGTKYTNDNLENLKTRLTDRMKSKDPQNALRIADDFRYMAGKGGFSPAVSKSLLDASEHLRKAYEGEQALSQERKPGGALALTAPEVQKARAAFEEKNRNLLEQQKTIGEFRKPELQKDLQAAAQEDARIVAQERLLAPQDTNDDPDKALNSVGVSRKDFVGSVADTAKKLKADLGDGVDFDKPVAFPYALPHVITALGPEAQVEFSTWARQELARKKKEEGDTQKQAEAGSKGEAGPSEDDRYRSELRGKIEGNFARQQQVRQEIANAQEFQSWPAVITYAILSVLIGPRGAFAFFSNARKKNTLGLWLDQLKAEMGDLQRQEDYERRDQEWNRREAARQSVRQAEREDDFQKDIRKEIMRHYLIKERANQRGVDTSTTKKISSDFSRYATLADDARAEITQQDKILESLTASDAMKRNAATIKERSRQQLEQYKEKMRQINELLETGGVPAQVGEGEE